MIGIDTNVLVRLIVKDDQRQTKQAETLLEKASVESEGIFITDIVLCELVWALRTSYRFDRRNIILALNQIIETVDFQFESLDRIILAFESFQMGRADFADYLIGIKCVESGCRTVATFDKALSSEPGFLSFN